MKSLSPPPYVGNVSATTVVVAYKNDGPHIFAADGTMGSSVGESPALASTGQDLVVVLPGRAYIPALEGAAAGTGHVAATGHTAGAGVYVNNQSTPLDRSHGAQIKVSSARHVIVVGGQITPTADYTVGGTVGVLEQQNRLLYVTGTTTGVTHIEGIAFTGDYQYEIFNYNGGVGTGTLLVWQNMAVRAGTDGVSVRYKPLPGTGTGNHSGGDIIQTFVMPRGVIVHGHYDEGATFQGQFLKVEAGQTSPQWVWLERVRSARYGGPGAWVYLMPDSTGATAPVIHMLDVAMQQAPMWGPSADGSTSEPRTPTVLTTLANNVKPTTESWYSRLTELPTTATVVESDAVTATPGIAYASPGYVLAAPPDPANPPGAIVSRLNIAWGRLRTGPPAVVTPKMVNLAAARLQIPTGPRQVFLGAASISVVPARPHLNVGSSALRVGSPSGVAGYVRRSGIWRIVRVYVFRSGSWRPISPSGG